MLNPLLNVGAKAAQNPERHLDLHEAIAFARRQWKLVAAITAVALLIGAIQIARATPLYTATTEVLLEPKRSPPIGPANESGGETFDYSISKIENEIATVRSMSLMRRVVEKERLAADPEFGSGGTPAAPGFSLGAALRALAPSQKKEEPSAPPSPAADGAPPETMASIGALSGATSVMRTGRSSILSISVVSTDPAKAARLANAVADAYAVDKLDARFEAAKRASAWLSDRLDDMRRQLRESEEAVVNFKAEHGIVQTSGNMTLSQEQLGQLNSRLIAARAETGEKKARVDLLASIEAKGGSVQSMPDAGASGALSGLRTQEADVSRREADLVARYGDRHPLVVNVRAERRDIQRAIGAELQRVASAIRSDYQLAKAREEALRKSLDEATGKGGVDERTAIALKELERTAAVNKTLFEEFLQKSKITNEKATFEASDVRVLRPAQPPGAPTSPKKGQTMLIAALLGLMAGVGSAYLLEILNAGFTTPRQAEELLGLPVLASIGRLGAEDLTVGGARVELPYLAAVKPLSRHSETVRALRSGIQMTDVDNPPKVIMATSTAPSEGKTSVALMLAVSAAASGLRVLLIDADLRRPSLSKFVGAEKEAGLVELLVGDEEAQKVIRFHEKGKFWTLGAGGKTQNPPDLLGSAKMKALIASVRNAFDYVIIDSPPVGPVIDPIVLAGLADKVVFIVKWAATSREAVADAVQKLGGHRKIAGVAFNMIDERRARQYGRYGQSAYGGSTYAKYYRE